MIKCLLSFDHIPLHDWESLFISFVIFHHMMKCYHIIYIKSHKETVTEQECGMDEKERDRESMCAKANEKLPLAHVAPYENVRKALESARVCPEYNRGVQINNLTQIDIKNAIGHIPDHKYFKNNHFNENERINFSHSIEIKHHK